MNVRTIALTVTALSILALAGTAAAAPAAAFSMERLDVAYRFENDGTYTHTVEARIHVTSEEGRRTLGEFYFPYQKRSSGLELRYLRTVKPTGETIEASPDRMFDVAPPSGRQSPVFSDLEYKAVPVPGLQVGDRIEYAFVRTTHAPLAPGQFWGHHALTRHVVVDVESVRLDLPADRAIAFQSDRRIDHSVERRDGRRIHTWTHRNPVPGTPPTGRNAYLFNLSTFRTWAELGSWMDGLVGERAVGTPELDALARRIVGDATDPRVRIQRLYEHVAQSVRYVQVRLGIGSYQPHPAADVQRNLYGDCKDKHTLLTVLLAAIGIDSEAALVHASQTVDPRVPTPEAFNHMITRVDLEDGPLWLDTTEELAPAGWLAPSLRGSRALVVQHEGSRLERLPDTVPVPDSRLAVLRGTIDSEGRLHADVRVEHRGSFEVGWRDLFRRGNDDAIRAAIRVGRPPTLRRAAAGPATSSDPLDTSGPFVVEYSLDQPDWWDAAAAAPAALPSMNLGAFARATPDDGELVDAGNSLAYRDFPERTEASAIFDEDLGVPLRLEERVFLTVPPGLAVEAPPDVREVRDFATYSATYVVRDGMLEATRALEISRTDLRPPEQAEVRALVEIIQADIERRLAIDVIGPDDARERR